MTAKENISKGNCAKEFQLFKDCYTKAVSNSNTCSNFIVNELSRLVIKRGSITISVAVISALLCSYIMSFENSLDIFVRSVT